MSKRPVIMILAILLLSYIPVMDDAAEPSTDIVLDDGFERIEISPDPNSIRDLGSPTTTEGIEEIRPESASSTIGLYTHSGLIPSEVLAPELALPRADLAIVIVSGDIGLWDARVQILESTDVEIRSTIPPSGFLIQGNPDQLAVLSENHVVESIHEVPAGLLIHPALRDAPLDEVVTVEIRGWKDSDLIRQDSTRFYSDSIQVAASEWMLESMYPEQGRMWGELAISDLSAIIKHPSIAFIAPVPVLELMNDRARINMGIDTVENTFVTGLNGSGQKIAVGDSGLDSDHGDFNGRVSGLHSVTPGDSSTADPSSGHGTHVACTVLGSGMRSNGMYAGIAPEASLYFQAMEDDDSGALYSYGINSMLNSAYNDNARLHTNSWGAQSGHGSYSTQSEDADDRISTWDQYWQYQGMTVLFAAGNERNDGVSPPGTAKNVITVGGHVNRYSGAPDDMYYWSSRGPTDDGRIKPDVVAPGDYVRSCKAQEASNAQGTWSNTWYLEYSGTSMATPAAAGAAALVREYLMEVANRPAPQASLIKALLILGAKDMGTRDIPNDDEGWGRVNLVNSLIPESDLGIFVDDRSRLSSGQSNTYTFDVTRSGEPLKVVLAWSDYPGSASSTNQLRNDLDLKITNPNGDVYQGNHFTNGRSVPGGSKDSTNNVEVVLVDNAMVGVWTVEVKDAVHGGSRYYQPYSIAVRGVNVNDLTPDPTFVPNTFDISVPIPQVGEGVILSVDVINQGAGSVSELNVLGMVNSQSIGLKTVSLSPGESTVLQWGWTPDTEGDNTIAFHIDPNDEVEEYEESNNFQQHTVIVSVPGVRVSADEPTKSLSGADDSSTTWDLTLTNTALFETNATIEVSEPVRLEDGAEFDWFSSFDSNTFDLEPAESKTVNLTVIHPAPPEPGTYKMLVTGIDTENNIESELEIFFEVPLLAEADIIMPSGQLIVSPMAPTPLQIQVKNEGNGPQTYDVELISPAGWHLGLNYLGAFTGSSHGSTGTLDVGETRTIDITVNPPGAMLPAGTVYQAAIQLHSRAGTESWSADIPMVVMDIDQVSLTPSSDGVSQEVESNEQLDFTIEFRSQGNRDLTFTPYMLYLPSGWSVVGGLQQFTVPKNTAVDWTFSIRGNGYANSGIMQLRFGTDDGFTVDWNRTLDVRSGADPRLEFHQVALPDGSNADSPLGAGPHPVGAPGFDLAWTVTNQGTMTWRPSISMELPDDDWSSTCSGPSAIQAGRSGTVWCTVVIPLSAEGGSEPEITLKMEGNGLEETHTISLLVASVNKVAWTITEQIQAPEGYPNSFTLQLQNVGNSDISEVLEVDGPSGWGTIILDGIIVDLRPTESRSVKILFTPDSGSDGEVSIRIKGASNIEDSSYSVLVDVLPGAGSDGIPIGTVIMIIVVMLVISGAFGLVLFTRKGGDLKSLIPEDTLDQIADKLNLSQDVQGGSGVECWICSQDIVIGEALACGECGARYHLRGQVAGCDIIARGRCLHCDAETDQLLEA